MLFLAVFLIILAVITLLLSRSQRHKTGLPGGRVIYADINRWGSVDKPLFDPILGLTGKPDYLVEHGNTFIPVEVKSGRISQSPYDSHIFQLAAYCLLAQRVYGVRPPYGILHYTNRTLAVNYTPEMETALLNLFAELRAKEGRKPLNRSHDSPGRCRRCGYRTLCDQSLA